MHAGLALVTLGLAWWYEKYAKEQSVDDAHRFTVKEHPPEGERISGT
jgi:hypothetical protein